jgi:hypothetical protein
MLATMDALDPEFLNVTAEELRAGEQVTVALADPAHRRVLLEGLRRRGITDAELASLTIHGGSATSLRTTTKPNAAAEDLVAGRQRGDLGRLGDAAVARGVQEDAGDATRGKDGHRRET